MSPTSKRRAITVLRLVAGLAASGGLGWLAIRGLGWGLVAEKLQAVSVPLLVLAVAVFLVASYVKAVRWRLLFVSERISVGRLFIIQNEGIGLNNLLPIRVASELTQLAVLTMRDGVGKATALATLRMERVIDVVASTMILGVAFCLVPEMKNFTIFVASAVPAAPSAVGTFEWAVVYVLTFFGVEREAGFGYAVIIHAVFFLPPTVIAIAFLPREGIISMSQVRSLALAGGRVLSRS